MLDVGDGRLSSTAKWQCGQIYILSASSSTSFVSTFIGLPASLSGWSDLIWSVKADEEVKNSMQKGQNTNFFNTAETVSSIVETQCTVSSILMNVSLLSSIIFIKLIILALILKLS
jgi:hypothetical protein